MTAGAAEGDVANVVVGCISLSGAAYAVSTYSSSMKAEKERSLTGCSKLERFDPS